MSSSASKVVFVSGANQGLGFEIVHVTALREPSSTYILACRKVEAGEDAVKKLRELGVKSQLEVLQLDVTNNDHIKDAVKHVEAKYGKLDVLVNNAGALLRPKDDSLESLREVYNNLMDLHVTSVAIVSTAFLPLLHKAPHPRVVNISSGLGSLTNQKIRKIGRYPPYGASKIGMNGVTMHMQVAETDRVRAEVEKGESSGEGRIKFYTVMPGVLRTAFTSNLAHGKDPKEGAEVVLRLIVAPEGTYEGGTFWEFEEGEMRVAPW